MMQLVLQMDSNFCVQLAFKSCKLYLASYVLWFEGGSFEPFEPPLPTAWIFKHWEVNPKSTYLEIVTCRAVVSS